MTWEKKHSRQKEEQGLTPRDQVRPSGEQREELDHGVGGTGCSQIRKRRSAAAGSQRGSSAPGRVWERTECL